MKICIYIYERLYLKIFDFLVVKRECNESYTLTVRKCHPPLWKGPLYTYFLYSKSISASQFINDFLFLNTKKLFVLCERWRLACWHLVTNELMNVLCLTRASCVRMMKSKILLLYYSTLMYSGMFINAHW